MLAELKELPGSPNAVTGPEWSVVRILGMPSFMPLRLWWASRLRSQKAAARPEVEHLS